MRNDIGADLPIETYRRWACNAQLFALIVDPHGVVLRHGRSRRLASRTQRRALLAMYDVCGLPHCTVTAQRCQAHHVIWSGRGGLTDLDSLLPVCSKHHHLIHEGGWLLELHPVTRDLTITYP